MVEQDNADFSRGFVPLFKGQNVIQSTKCESGKLIANVENLFKWLHLFMAFHRCPSQILCTLPQTLQITFCTSNLDFYVVLKQNK